MDAEIKRQCNEKLNFDFQMILRRNLRHFENSNFFFINLCATIKWLTLVKKQVFSSHLEKGSMKRRGGGEGGVCVNHLIRLMARIYNCRKFND